MNEVDLIVKSLFCLSVFDLIVKSDCRLTIKSQYATMIVWN